MHTGRVLEHALKVIEQYNGNEPLHRQLSRYFSANRSMGARDRRACRSLVYSYFRLGKALDSLSSADRMAAGAWLMNELPREIMDVVVRGSILPFPERIPELLDERISVLRSLTPGFDFRLIFPFTEELSPAINGADYCRSMLVQPLVWIRAKSSKVNDLQVELDAKGIVPLSIHSERSAFAFSPGTQLDQLDAFKSGYFEVQDFSSQQVSDFLHPQKGQRWWDACAASGGKSLLLLEKEPDLRLTATDVRSSILENYRDRLSKAGYHHVEVKQMDLAAGPVIGSGPFQGIVADVPCSGSGTWARTPEQLSSFKSDSIRSHYVPLQRKIVENTVPQLEADGQFVYITCSVFAAENEDNVNWMVNRFRLEVVSKSYISCYFDRADTMFVAVLRRLT